jgi:hypothetical protein
MPCCVQAATGTPAAGQEKLSSADSISSDFPVHVSTPIDIGQALDRTLGEILVEAEGVLLRFNSLRRESDLFLGIDADIDDRRVHRSGVLIHNLSRFISALRKHVDAAAHERLSNLPEQPRSDAIRLYMAVRRLHLLLEGRDRCGYHNLDSFLAAVETLALGTGARQIDVTSPVLHFFAFEDQLPDVVPSGGGWLVLFGSGLWQDGNLEAALIDPDTGKTIALLDAHHTGVDETAAVKIEPEWVAGNAGQCLSLAVGRNLTSGMPWRKRREPAAQAQLPFCIPQSFNTKYQLAGFLEYQTPTQTTYLVPKGLLFENDSCVDRKPVSEILEWNLPPGGWLLEMRESALYEAGSSSVECEVSENRVTCSGYLGKAVCGRALLEGNNGIDTELLLEQTEWEHIFSPIAEYPIAEEHESRALSDAFELESSATEIILQIPREKPSEKTTIWYELIAVNGGQHETVFVSPKRTILEKQQEAEVTAHVNMTVELDPAPELPEAAIRASIGPADCPY